MANKIVKDSGLAIFVKEVAVSESTAIGTLVREGAKVGLTGDTPYKGEDGDFYVTIDTAALIRLDSVAIAFTDGAPVYMTPGGAASGTATSNFLIGYADRAKGAASGKLFVQLVPRAVIAAGGAG